MPPVGGFTAVLEFLEVEVKYQRFYRALLYYSCCIINCSRFQIPREVISISKRLSRGGLDLHVPLEPFGFGRPRGYCSPISNVDEGSCGHEGYLLDDVLLCTIDLAGRWYCRFIIRESI